MCVALWKAAYSRLRTFFLAVLRLFGLLAAQKSDARQPLSRQPDSRQPSTAKRRKKKSKTARNNRRRVVYSDAAPVSSPSAKSTSSQFNFQSKKSDSRNASKSSVSYKPVSRKSVSHKLAAHKLVSRTSVSHKPVSHKSVSHSKVSPAVAAASVGLIGNSECQSDSFEGELRISTSLSRRTRSSWQSKSSQTSRQSTSSQVSRCSISSQTMSSTLLTSPNLTALGRAHTSSAMPGSSSPQLVDKSTLTQTSHSRSVKNPVLPSQTPIISTSGHSCLTFAQISEPTVCQSEQSCHRRSRSHNSILNNIASSSPTHSAASAVTRTATSKCCISHQASGDCVHTETVSQTPAPSQTPTSSPTPSQTPTPSRTQIPSQTPISSKSDLAKAGPPSKFQAPCITVHDYSARDYALCVRPTGERLEWRRAPSVFSGSEQSAKSTSAARRAPRSQSLVSKFQRSQISPRGSLRQFRPAAHTPGKRKQLWRQKPPRPNVKSVSQPSNLEIFAYDGCAPEMRYGSPDNPLFTHLVPAYHRGSMSSTDSCFSSQNFQAFSPYGDYVSMQPSQQPSQQPKSTEGEPDVFAATSEDFPALVSSSSGGPKAAASHSGGSKTPATDDRRTPAKEEQTRPLNVSSYAKILKTPELSWDSDFWNDVISEPISQKKESENPVDCSPLLSDSSSAIPSPLIHSLPCRSVAGTMPGRQHPNVVSAVNAVGQSSPGFPMLDIQSVVGVDLPPPILSLRKPSVSFVSSQQSNVGRPQSSVEVSQSSVEVSQSSVEVSQSSDDISQSTDEVSQSSTCSQSNDVIPQSNSNSQSSTVLQLPNTDSSQSSTCLSQSSPSSAKLLTELHEKQEQLEHMEKLTAWLASDPSFQQTLSGETQVKLNLNMNLSSPANGDTQVGTPLASPRSSPVTSPTNSTLSGRHPKSFSPSSRSSVPAGAKGFWRNRVLNPKQINSVHRRGSQPRTYRPHRANDHHAGLPGGIPRRYEVLADLDNISVYRQNLLDVNSRNFLQYINGVKSFNEDADRNNFSFAARQQILRFMLSSYQRKSSHLHKKLQALDLYQKQLLHLANQPGHSRVGSPSLKPYMRSPSTAVGIPAFQVAPGGVGGSPQSMVLSPVPSQHVQHFHFHQHQHSVAGADLQRSRAAADQQLSRPPPQYSPNPEPSPSPSRGESDLEAHGYSVKKVWKILKKGKKPTSGRTHKVTRREPPGSDGGFCACKRRTSAVDANQLTDWSSGQILPRKFKSRLHKCLSQKIPVLATARFPNLELTPQQVVSSVCSSLDDQHVSIKDVRLNGSAAAYIVGDDEHSNEFYNDADIVFNLGRLPADPAGPRSVFALFERVRAAVTVTLLGFVREACAELPNGAELMESINETNVTSFYVDKMIKVPLRSKQAPDDEPMTDYWSLMSLRNPHRRNIELKFVYRLQRSFEFPVDSFQVILRPAPPGSSTDLSRWANESPDHMPEARVEATCGNLGGALAQLNRHAIVFDRPENLRGGGLLKFCKLLLRGFVPEPSDIPGHSSECAMLVRFLVDFPSAEQKWSVICKYLSSHFSTGMRVRCMHVCTRHHAHLYTHLAGRLQFPHGEQHVSPVEAADLWLYLLILFTKSMQVNATQDLVEVLKTIRNALLSASLMMRDASSDELEGRPLLAHVMESVCASSPFP
eukprot:14472_1